MTNLLIYQYDYELLERLERITGDTKAEIVEDAIFVYVKERLDPKIAKKLLEG